MTTNVGGENLLNVELSRDGRWVGLLKSTSPSIHELSRLRERGYREIYRLGESIDFLIHTEWIVRAEEVVGLGITNVCETTQMANLQRAYSSTHIDQYSYAVLFDTPRGVPQYTIFPDIVGPDVILENPAGALVSWFDVSRLSTAQKQSLEQRLVVLAFAE